MKENHDVGEPALEPEKFLKQLKAEHKVLRWEPLPPDHVRKPTANDQIRTRENLEFLHHHWALPDTFDPADGGSGLRGKVVSAFGRLTYRVLARYLREERELLSHLVRVNQALEQRCDELTSRCQQLNEDMVSRQVAEAGNQAKLSAWLHADQLRAAAPGSGNHKAGNGDSASRR